MSDAGRVEKHYASAGITARVLAALRRVNGPDVSITPDTLAPIDHFHRTGVIATEELAAMLQPQVKDHVLDIGCGIGGLARWIAAKYGCNVTGVDFDHGVLRGGARAQWLVWACRPCADPARLRPLASTTGQ